MTKDHLRKRLGELRRAARDVTPVSGLTHCFYRYPARFSPRFAAAAIEAFSESGDLVLDPFMGGGTAIVEALVRGRDAVGCDLNSLAVFVTRAKTTTLSRAERQALEHWANEVVPDLRYSARLPHAWKEIADERARNLHLPSVRSLKKVIALALLSLDKLPTDPTRDFARCALLRASQWAINGRERHIRLSNFRSRLRDAVHEMIREVQCYRQLVGDAAVNGSSPTLINDSAENLSRHRPFSNGALADLVVTSPPYPGVHILYHRWQVNGGRETPAPYWIAACSDGRGEAFYNLGDRREPNQESYFSALLRNLKAIREVVRKGALFVQMVAFGDPQQHLRRYLQTMQAAGFEEVRTDIEAATTRHRRVWRSVPNRTWHASLKGELPSSREVLLVHRAG